MIELLLTATGLYYGQLAKQDFLIRFYRLSRAFFFFTLTTLYFGRSLVRIFVINVFPNKPIDLEYIVIWGWQLQAVISMMFLFYWQRRRIIKYLLEDILISRTILGKSFTMYRKLKCTFYQWVILVVTMSTTFGVTIIADTIQKIIRSGDSITKPTMGLHPFDFIYRLVPVYGVFVWNIVLCFFVIVMKCLSLELKEFNRSLDKLLHEDQPIPWSTSRLSTNLMVAFDVHKRLAKKIRRADNIFQFYILLTMAVGTPTTIFAIIVMLRRKTWVGMFFSIHDVICCTTHLIGFTIVPAQIHSEYHSVRTQLCRNSSLWQQYDAKLYHITLMFIDHITQANAGISLGGLVVIRKSLLFTCVSLVTPYVVLSLQLNVGGPNSFFKVSNHTAYT
ncbi:GUstatory Receptor family [Ditylenchus destructor]|uniref:GUstatory Receptor family n=1 Tax=Ditylenchus destructor TaxID=166010 RepID=A0AAD4MRC7_9BILA|nr:GUstatory Receptor family [Ditylenchus destructor]